MNLFLKDFIKLKNIDNWLLFLLIFSFFRYHSREIDFFFGSFNIIRYLGLTSFYLLLIIPFFYLMKLDKKIIVYFVLIISFWIVINFFFNYQKINFDFIKKNIQVIYCILIFLIFSNVKFNLNFHVLKLISIFIISSTIILNVFYEENNSKFNFIFLVSIISISIFIYLFNKKNYLFFSLFIYLTIFYLYKLILIEYPYNATQLSNFTRANAFSWMVLCLFCLILFFEKKNSHVEKKSYLLILIIIFSINFISLYIIIAQISILFLYYINFAFNHLIKFVLLFILSLLSLYVYLIIFQIDFFLNIINSFFNLFSEPNAYGIIKAKDKNYEIIYELAKISQNEFSVLAEIYYGLVHRLLISKIYLQNLFNGLYIDANYNMEVSLYILFFDHNIQLPKDMTQFNYYSKYLNECIKNYYNVEECVSETNLFNGYISRNASYNIHHALVNYGNVNFQTIYRQTFNSSHSQYIGLFNHFGYLGIVMMTLAIFYLLKEILLKNSNIYFCIFATILCIILNFDDYLFYNYFNTSFFIWFITGLFFNKNFFEKI